MNEQETVWVELPQAPDNIYDGLPEGASVALTMDLQHVIACAPDWYQLRAKVDELGGGEFALGKVPPRNMLLVL